MRTRVFYVQPSLFLDALDKDYQPLARNYEYAATIDADSPEQAWVQMNRGSGEEVGALIGRRSMSVGDIVYMGDLYYLCQGVGWKPLPPSDEMTALYLKAIAAETAARSGQPVLKKVEK